MLLMHCLLLFLLYVFNLLLLFSNFKFCNHLDQEEGTGYLAFIVFQMYCDLSVL